MQGLALANTADVESYESKRSGAKITVTLCSLLRLKISYLLIVLMMWIGNQQTTKAKTIMPSTPAAWTSFLVLFWRQ